MIRQLVEFPKVGDEWEEVGSVGLSVLAALPRDVMTWVGRTLANATIIRPASGVMLPASQFWSNRETLRDDERLLKQSVDLFGKGAASTTSTAAQSPPSGVVSSVAMDACIRLGASERALRSRRTGEYWRASQDDLTASGFLTLNQLHIAFHRAPLILTFVGNERMPW